MASQVYYAVDGSGDFYDCVNDAGAGENPITAPAKWSRLEIPQRFEPYLKQRAYSIALLGDGQNDKAGVEAKIAADMLEDMVARERTETGRLTRPRVFTR